MFTYHRELEKKGWHRSWQLRLALVVLGLFLGLLGLFEWSMEQDKGGWEGSVLADPFTVEEGIEDVEVGTYRALVRGEDGEILFEGTSSEEVDAWIESQRSRNFTVPILLFAGSAVLLMVGIGPSPRRPELSDAAPRVEART